MIDKIKISLLILLSIIFISFSQSWETIGGNSARTSYLDVIGPDKPDILWEGSIYSIIGLPILISNNKLVTSRVKDDNWTDAPIVCHDLYSGDTIWTLDFPGGRHSTSIPVGFRNNVVYATNWFALFSDTLYALNAENGEIIWRSSITVIGNYFQGISFTGNGDIIMSVLDGCHIARISRENGDTIWCIQRNVPVVASYCAIAVYEETAYAWNSVINEPLKLIAIDVNNGNIKYGIEIPCLNPPSVATAPHPVIDKNGTIYALRADDNLVAIEDKGDSLSSLWNIPIVDGGYTKPAIGPDGSIYFTNHIRIMRADPSTGNIIDSSIIIAKLDTMQYVNGHFAIDALGKVYFNNGRGVLYFFTKELELKHTDTVENMIYGGPSLGPGGILVVAGKGNILKVYHTDNTNCNENISIISNPVVYHTCFPSYINFKYYIQNNTNVKLSLFNTRGQKIYSWENMPNSTGFHNVNIRDIHDNFSSGRFIYKLNIGDKSSSNTLSIVK